VVASEDRPIAGESAGGDASKGAEARLGSTVAGRYRIEELVAQGGIASVFRAVRLSDGQEMAIKILHPEAEGRAELTTYFEREAIAGKHIFHPNVVTVHESARLDDGSFYLVQDFVRGETLRELIDRGPVPPLRAARIARQVAAGLNAAHDMGIVHRDVKPPNLMFAGGPDELVQIVDFGMARVPVEDLSVHVSHGRYTISQSEEVVLGTMAYLAPEAALGMAAIDRRSDLYALGVILYEMLAGRHPFTADDPIALFQQQCQSAPPPIRERSPGVEVPPLLEHVVVRLMAKAPADRYQHARAVIVALDIAIRSMESTPPLTDPAESVPTLPPRPGLSGRAVAGVAVAVAAFAVLAISLVAARC
jgi:serine/threonine-protein kinase